MGAAGDAGRDVRAVSPLPSSGGAVMPQTNPPLRYWFYIEEGAVCFRTLCDDSFQCNHVNVPHGFTKITIHPRMWERVSSEVERLNCRLGHPCLITITTNPG